jgi:hypothetical protein
VVNALAKAGIELGENGRSPLSLEPVNCAGVNSFRPKPLLEQPDLCVVWRNH